MMVEIHITRENRSKSDEVFTDLAELVNVRRELERLTALHTGMVESLMFRQVPLTWIAAASGIAHEGLVRRSRAERAAAA